MSHLTAHLFGRSRRVAAGLVVAVLAVAPLLPGRAGAAAVALVPPATEVQPMAVFREPPPGGITVGMGNLLTPRALVAAQPFEVTSLSAYDPASQRFVTYVPGSPFNVGGDAPLAAGLAVFIRRSGELPSALPVPAVAAVQAGTPSAFSAPAPGASVAGVAGTGDLGSLVAAQPFAVESVSMWDTPSQRWLVHVVGAPAFANTLASGLLRVDSVVFVRRSATAVAAAAAPTAAPAAATASPPNTGLRTASFGVATITYYYCAPGARDGAAGDGGGFCGYMANGQVVHPGAASCAAAYMGQRFLIAGDPLARVYTCEDTGGAVTAGHRDIWFADADAGADWWRVVGQSAEIFVVLP